MFGGFKMSRRTSAPAYVDTQHYAVEKALGNPHVLNEIMKHMDLRTASTLAKVNKLAYTTHKNHTKHRYASTLVDGYAFMKYDSDNRPRFTGHQSSSRVPELPGDITYTDQYVNQVQVRHYQIIDMDRMMHKFRSVFQSIHFQHFPHIIPILPSKILPADFNTLLSIFRPRPIPYYFGFEIKGTNPVISRLGINTETWLFVKIPSGYFLLPYDLNYANAYKISGVEGSASLRAIKNTDTYKELMTMSVGKLVDATSLHSHEPDERDVDEIITKEVGGTIHFGIKLEDEMPIHFAIRDMGMPKYVHTILLAPETDITVTNNLNSVIFVNKKIDNDRAVRVNLKSGTVTVMGRNNTITRYIPKDRYKLTIGRKKANSV